MNTGFFEAISANDFLHCLKVLFLDQILITTVVALYITAPLLGSYPGIAGHLVRKLQFDNDKYTICGSTPKGLRNLFGEFPHENITIGISVE